jgi:undecaprenyl-diphosphatase
MSFATAALLGLVEGITEFLPISSTGHLLLAEWVLQIQKTPVVLNFDMIIQLGAILAVVVLYWRTILLSRRTILLVIAGFIPTGIVGLALRHLQPALMNEGVVGTSLLLGGLFLIGFERIHREHKYAPQGIESITFRQAAIIGLFQSIAIIPGVSRSAATIIGGLLLGIRRKTIVEFSFLLAIPTMLAATCLSLLHLAPGMTAHDGLAIGIGFATAFISALVAVRWLLRFIQSHTFTGFGIYRVVLALVVLAALIALN